MEIKMIGGKRNGKSYEMFKQITKKFNELEKAHEELIAENNQLKDGIRKVEEELCDTGAYEQEVVGKTQFLGGISYSLEVIQKYLGGFIETEDKEQEK